jgi:hypothetical protein
MTKGSYLDYAIPQPVIGWIANHARKNYWRLADWYDLDDLIHDGLMKAYECKARYGVPGETIDHPHYMRLVQTSFRNHIGELLRHMRGVDDHTKLTDMAMVDQDETDVIDRIAEADETPQDYALLLAELPPHLHTVVSLMSSVDGSKALRKRLRTRLSGHDETAVERLHKLTGYPVDRNFEAELRTYLWERENGLLEPKSSEETVADQCVHAIAEAIRDMRAKYDHTLRKVNDLACNEEAVARI